MHVRATHTQAVITTLRRPNFTLNPVSLHLNNLGLSHSYPASNACPIENRMCRSSFSRSPDLWGVPLETSSVVSSRRRSATSRRCSSSTVVQIASLERPSACVTSRFLAATCPTTRSSARIRHRASNRCATQLALEFDPRLSGGRIHAHTNSAAAAISTTHQSHPFGNCLLFSLNRNQNNNRRLVSHTFALV